MTIVGVHSPEADYEKSIENVRRQVRELGISYPVVTDNDYTTWRAYNIQAWPTVVILDRAGRIRYTHIGEGAYEQQEQIIQKLITEKVADNGSGKAAAEIASSAHQFINASQTNPGTSERKNLAMTDKVRKTDEEWRRELTPEQFRIMRQKGTERAFTGEYNNAKAQGVYRCAACAQELFSSDAKFDSGTGWPSFYQPVTKKNVSEETDTSHGMKRL